MNSTKSGILGILALILGVLVIFFVLNYFNILSLSQLYPNLFASLPHKQISKTNLSLLPAPTPKNFPYDWNYAQTALEKFIKDNLKTEFLPAKIEGKQGLIATDSGKGTEYEYGAKWRINDLLIVSFFHYGFKTNIPSDMEFIIQIPNTTEIVATESLTNELTQKYLKNISKTTFVCKNFTKDITYCTNDMKITSNGKKGYGLGIDHSHNLTLLISCFVPKDGIYYNKWSNCAGGK